MKRYRTILPSKYKGVTGYIEKGVTTWRARLTLNGRTREKFADTEEQAARFYDIFCIETNKQPVNFFKKVEK